jgi:hypothetical protein
MPFTYQGNNNMKISAAVLLAIGFLHQGSAFAIDADVTVKGAQKKASLTRVVARQDAEASTARVAAKSCAADGTGCLPADAYKSCGAFVADNNRHGYGFGIGKAAATSKAQEMCGQEACAVVVAECED